GEQKYLAARPTVDEHPRERRHHRKRQQEHGEGGGDGPCARVLLGVEEHEPGQTRLVDPVGELRHQTSSEQTAEPGAPKDHTQITEEGGGHDLRVGGPCRGSVFEGNRRVTGEHTGRRYTHEEGVYRR